MRCGLQLTKLHRGDSIAPIFYTVKNRREQNMKVSEAIQQVKIEKPNGYSDTHCTVFLNEIEAIIQEFLGIPSEERVKYKWEDSQQQELIVPEPYSAIYISYLKAKIDYAQEEYESY